MGYIGDRFGTKTALTMSVAMMLCPSVLIGCLPPYRVAGASTTVALVALRLLQGLAVGGEVVGGYIYTIEATKVGGVVAWWRGAVGPPPHTQARRQGRRKGFWGGACKVRPFPSSRWTVPTPSHRPAAQATGNLGTAAGMGVSALLRGCLSDAALRSWGWRVPFLATVVLGAVGLWLRRGLEDNKEEAEEGDEEGGENEGKGDGEDDGEEEGEGDGGSGAAAKAVLGGEGEGDCDGEGECEGRGERGRKPEERAGGWGWGWGWGGGGSYFTASDKSALLDAAPTTRPHLYLPTLAVAATHAGGSAPLTPTPSPTPAPRARPATPNPTVATLTQHWREVVVVVGVVSFWSVGFYRCVAHSPRHPPTRPALTPPRPCPAPALPCLAPALPCP